MGSLDTKGTPLNGFIVPLRISPPITFINCIHAECNAHHLRTLKGIIEAYMSQYHELIAYGKKENAIKNGDLVSGKTGKPKKGAALNLIEKIEKYDLETLAFMLDFDVPFDNNLAERDLRMVKLRQKISGCFCGVKGNPFIPQQTY